MSFQHKNKNPNKENYNIVKAEGIHFHFKTYQHVEIKTRMRGNRQTHLQGKTVRASISGIESAIGLRDCHRVQPQRVLG